MNKKIALPLLLLLFAAQWATPLAQVYREESIRREGATFRLALQPVDPYDVMRGRYLALSFPPPPAPLQAPAGKKIGDTVYAVLQNDAQGLAYIARLSATPEAHAIAVPLYYGVNIPGGGVDDTQVRVDIPLTRFYLPEDDAIALDNILTQTTNNERAQAALDVRVKDGRVVAESLWLDGRPYREWLADYLATQKP